MTDLRLGELLASHANLLEIAAEAGVSAWEVHQRIVAARPPVPNPCTYCRRRARVRGQTRCLRWFAAYHRRRRHK